MQLAATSEEHVGKESMTEFSTSLDARFDASFMGLMLTPIMLPYTGVFVVLHFAFALAVLPSILHTYSYKLYKGFSRRRTS